MWEKYGKALIAVAVALVTAAQAGLSDQHLTPQEVVQVLIATATAIGVYLVPVVPSWPWAKTVVAVVLAVLNVAVTAVVGGLTSGDWTEMLLAAFTVLAVGVAPARSAGQTRSRQ